MQLQVKKSEEMKFEAVAAAFYFFILMNDQ